MPLLGSLLSSLFVGIAEFFAKWVSRKVAAVGAAIAVMATLTGTLYVALGALVSGIAWSLPASQAVSLGIWLVVPDNGPACVAACLAADAAIAIYRLNVLNVQFAIGAS